MVNDITKFQKVDPETIKTMVNFSEKKYEEMVMGEREAIPFAKIQNNIKPHVIIGHNSNGFDMLFIMRRLEWLGSTMMEEFYRIATDAIEYTYIKFDGTLFWYSMTIFQREFPGRQSSLNYMLDTLEIPSKIGLSYRHIDEIVLLAIETAKIQDEMTKLNVDSMDYHNKIEELNSRQNKVINNLHGEEGLKSFVQISLNTVSTIHAKEYNKEHNDKSVLYSIKDKKKFQGAEVIDPETGYEKPNEKHQVVHLIDNNVGTNQDIYFIHEDTQESIIRNILKDLIKKRKEAKKERDKYIGINDVMYNILEQKQLAYKASANALYGGLGSPYLESYHTGEYRDDQNMICDETSEVIYGDTDSCLARLPKRILCCILEKYYGHLKYIELNNGLVKEYEELIFKMYDELTKEGSIFGKKKRYAGYKFELQSNRDPPDYFFSEIFSGTKNYISRNAKLFNKRLIFDEIVNIFLTESDEFKKYAVMNRFSNIHVRGLPIVRRDANNSSK
ncbi:26532_t:CDS:2, partial [Racocetra persica]